MLVKSTRLIVMGTKNLLFNRKNRGKGSASFSASFPTVGLNPFQCSHSRGEWTGYWFLTNEFSLILHKMINKKISFYRELLSLIKRAKTTNSQHASKTSFLWEWHHITNLVCKRTAPTHLPHHRAHLNFFHRFPYFNTLLIIFFSLVN